MARGRVSRIGSRPNPEEYCTQYLCKLVSERERRSLRESRRRSERGVGREITALTDWAPPIQFHKTKRLPVPVQ